MQVLENVALAPYTTFQIGGPARFFIAVKNTDELAEAIQFAREKKLPIFILGNGSNILVSDKGFDGLVIHNDLRGVDISPDGVIKVAAGENWDDIVRAAVDRNLAGIECLSGIPGSTGGAVVQNVGAYGQTLSEVVVGVEGYNLESGERKTFSIEECEFAYRNSWFKRHPAKFILTKFKLQLTPAGQPNVTYPDVQKYLNGKPQVTLGDVRNAVIQIRGAKGYLIMDGFEKFLTAGSYFKNPFVSDEIFKSLEPILGDISHNRFWQTSKGVKLAAAFLMQEAGFAKGYREGKVGISPKHSLSIINLGGATANEIKTFAQRIKDRVLEKFNVQLEEEVIYV